MRYRSVPKAGVALVTEALGSRSRSRSNRSGPLLFLPFPFLPLLSCLSSVRTPALACFTVTAANRAYVYRNSGRGKGGIKLKPRRHTSGAALAWASGTYARTLIIVTIHTRTRLSTRPLNTCTTQLEDRASTSVGGNRGFRARMRPCDRLELTDLTAQPCPRVPRKPRTPCRCGCPRAEGA